RLDRQRQTSKSRPFSAQQQDCATRSFFAKFLDHREVCSLSISLEALELRRWRRSFTIRLAGVAELADALDSKASVFLRERLIIRNPGNSTATLLPVLRPF